MAEIKLVFRPDVSEVSKAVKSIQESINKELGHIKINIDSGAQQATQNLAANLQKVSQASSEADIAIKKTETRVDGVLKKTTELIKTATGEYKESVTEQIKDGERLTETLIHNEQEKRKEAEKTAKEIAKQQQSVLDAAEKHRQEQIKREDKWRKDEIEYERETAKQVEAVYEEQRKKMAVLLQEQAQYEADIHRKNAEAIQFEAQNQKELRKEQERTNRAREKAADTSFKLERQYSNLIRQIQNLKAQYPEGTFDAIEQQAMEARDELRNLDRTSEDYVKNVGNLGKTYQGLQRDMSNVRQETGKLEKVTESLWMNIQKFARWYIIGNVFTQIMNSFREALRTMKEVDTELANIQKVTDRTDAEMQKLAESAYRAASAYGVSAQAYLESAAEFAKAGFGDRAEELAEVAIKTQLVGDVSADVADKFLLASNAAWKMDGNMQLLNKTLDAANTIENNYATSIEKLAAGMPIAASVAANAGMTFEQTIAALGTITSVTQETGTKAATALRALMLNIIGAVGEYEDGIEVTEESVKSLDGILQVYAKDAMKAAQEAGTVINPMEAIAALAKASKEGLVNQAELFEILSSLGGKLRTNQLISLVQNYDIFLEMLDKTKDSAGSADKEIGVMLDTWEAKTNILQNTWTEFITNFVNTEGIKTSIDIVTGLVSLLDTKVGHLLITAAGIPTVIFSIATVVSKLKDSVVGLTAAMTANPMFLAIVAGGVAISGLIALADALTTSTKEYADAVKAAEDAYARTQGELDTLKTKATELTDIERQKLIILEEQERIQKEQVRRAKVDQYNALYGDINAYEQATALVEQYLAYKDRLEKTTDPEVFKKTSQGLNNVYTNILDTLSGLLDFREAIGLLPPSGNEAIRVLNEFVNSLRGEEDAAEKAGQSTEALTPIIKSLKEKLQEVSETATKYDTAIGGVVDAMGDFGAGSIEVYNAMKSLEETIPGSTDKLYDFDTATVLAGDDIFTSKEAMLDFIDSSKQLEFSQAISELEDMAAAYWDVAGAALAAMANQQAAAQMAGVLGFTTGGNSPVSSAEAQLAAVRRDKAEWDAYITTLRGRKDYRGGGSRDYTPVSSSPERTTDEELERLKAIVSWEKAELNYLQASGKSLEDINKKRKSIQEALHEQAEYMRSALALMDDTNSTEAERKAYEQAILDLSTEWWSIQKDINDDLAKAEEDRIKALEEENKLLEEQKKLQQEMFDTIKATVDEYLKKQTSEEEKQLSLLEKQLAVKKAEEALENAKKERTVRYYNAATDQWEWRANAKNVKSAEDALEKAQDDLAKYSRSQAYAEFTSAWEEVSTAIKSGKTTFQDAYKYMYDAMKKIQDTYGVDLGLTLEDSIGGFKDLNGGIDSLTTEVTEKLKGSVGNLGKQLTKYEGAVGALRTAFESAFKPGENGEVPAFETAVGYLSDEVKKIAGLYGVDMTGAVQRAIDGFDKTNGSIEELWVSVISNLMKVNSARWWDASPEEQTLLHAQNDYLGKLIGATYENGYWYRNGQLLYGSQKGVSYDAEGNLIASPSGGGGGSTPTSSTVGGLVSGGGSSSDGPTTARYVGTVSDVDQDKLTAATPEQIELLTKMASAAAAGDWNTAANINNTLSAGGNFQTYIGEDGLAYGYLVGVSGATAGSKLYVSGSKLPQTGIETGAVFADAFGNYYQVGSDGHSTTKIDPSTLQNNYERWVYDSGGILKGVGGIKATARDELILGPELTQKATKLAGSADSNRVLDLVGGLLGAAAKILPFSQNTVGSQYNGSVYQLGNVTMTEGQARTTSVYELAHMASGLGIFNNRT